MPFLRLAPAALLPFLLLPTALGQSPAAAVQPILNGRPTTLDELRGTVVVVTASDRRLHCSGTLVSPTVALTAAHCLYDEQGFLRDPRSLAVVAGELAIDVETPEEIPTEHVFEVVSGVPHPEFLEAIDPTRPADVDPSAFDLAVLLLGRPVTVIEPVRIASRRESERAARVGATVVLEGFGVDDLETYSAGRLLRTTATVIGAVPRVLVIAAQDETQGDSCFGDSGGPVYVTIDDEPVVVGATSRGRPDSAVDCGNGGIYAALGYHRGWIAETAADPSLDPKPGGRCAIGVGGERPGSTELAALGLALAALARRRLRGS